MRDKVLRFKHYINVTVNYHEFPYFIPFIKINKKKGNKKVCVSLCKFPFRIKKLLISAH